MFEIRRERPSDASCIEYLLDLSFGLSRLEKASYSIRENTPPLDYLSFVACLHERLVGTIRFWPIVVRDFIHGTQMDAVLLGPIAVDEKWQGSGVGAKLVAHSLRHCATAGHQRILLVGDIAYYGQFGFQPVLPSYITLPGGRDARRLLVKQSAILPSLPAVGRVERRAARTCLEPNKELAFAS